MLAFIFQGYLSIACSCTSLSIEEAVAKSTIITKVTVLEVELNFQLDQSESYLDSLSRRDEKIYFGSFHTNQYLMKVETIYKGQFSEDTITLRTALDPVTDCGLILQKGLTYILYSEEVRNGHRYFDSGSNRFLVTSSACTLSSEYSKRHEKKIVRAVRRAIN